ncbi:tetratricopeptide repeat protein [bacterium]|nr:tetratricopeptide repeat protein [bacterium]
MIELSETNIENLRKEYGDQLTYLYCDLIGGLNATEKLYTEPEFNYHIIWEPSRFVKAIFENLGLIIRAIDKNLPNLPRIKAEQPTVNIAFCRNLWLHELLLHESWEDSEQKTDYLNYAFQETFREFDTKAVSNFDTEFLPYDMPWASVAYHFVPSEELPKYELEVYENFYKPHFLDKARFHAPNRETLKFNDALNFALRISNKLKDYKLRVMYFDVKRFLLYEELSKLIKEENPSSNIKNILYSFLYYEFKRAIIWNSAFLLSAPEFRDLIDFLRGRTLIEEIRHEELSRERLLRQLIQQVEAIQPPESEQTRKIDLNPTRDSLTQYPTITTIQPIIQTPSLIREEIPYEFLDPTNMGRYVYQDLTTFMEKWEKGLRIRRAFLLLDNHQLLDEQGRKVVAEIKQVSDKIYGIKAINRDEKGNPLDSILIEQIGATPYELASLSEGNVSKIASYLACLNGFDKGLVSLLAKHLNIEWTSEDWEIFGRYEWVQSRSQNWFYIDKSQAVSDIIKPEDDLPAECREPVFDYLNNYKSNLDEEAKTARIDGLAYGFRWKLKTTVARWLNLWLSAIEESNFDLAEQVILLGRQYESQILPELATNQSFDNLFASITYEVKRNLKNKSEELTKKQHGDLLRKIRQFYSQGLALNISLENRLLYLQAGASLLSKFTNRTNDIRGYIRFCEGKKDLFSESPQSYLWFIIELHIRNFPDSGQTQKYLKQFVTYPAQNVEQWGKLAQAHFMLRNFEEFLDAAEEFIKFKPDNVNMLSNLINVLMALKRFDEAKEKIEEILSSDKHKESTRFRILKGKMLNSCGEKDEARKWFETLIQDEKLDDKSKASIWNEIAEIIPDGDAEEKENALKKAISLAPDNFNAISDLMVFYIRQDNLEKAKQILQDFIADKPDDDTSKIILQLNFHLNTGNTSEFLPLLQKLPKTIFPKEILEALLYLKGGSYREALNTIENLLKLIPEHAPALRLKLELQFRSKKPKKKKLQDNRAKEIKATINRLEKINALTEKDYLRIAKFYLKYENPDEALIWLDKIKNESAQTTKFLSTKGEALFSSKRYEEAIKLYDQALDVNSEDAMLWTFKGMCHFNLREYKESLRCIDGATSLDSKDVDFNLKITSEQELSVLGTFKGLSGLWVIKGFALMNLNQNEEALIAFNEAIVLDSKNPDIWSQKAFCLYKQERYSEALDAIDKAISISPEEAEFWSVKAGYLTALEKYDEALDTIDKAISISPEEAEFWSNKGQILWCMRSFQKSLESMEKALSFLDDNDKLSLGFKASLLIILGREAEADLFFDQFLKAGGKEANVYYDRACAYALLERHDEALSELKEAISLDEEWRERAKTDPDFESLREMEEFQRLVNSNKY